MGYHCKHHLSATTQIHGWSTYQLFGVVFATDFAFTYPLISTNERSDFLFTCQQEAPFYAEWSELSLISEKEYQTTRGAFGCQLYHLADCQVLRLSNVGDFYIWSERIICHPCSPFDPSAIERYFVGHVLTIWQESHDHAVLHASAVVVQNQAVAFIANSGTGKSGLAATFLQAGYPLLTDDTLVLKAEDHAAPLAQSGYPQMRMWPPNATHFLGTYEHLPRVVPTTDKRRVPIGVDGIGTFYADVMRLGALFVLERRPEDTHDDAIKLEKLPPSVAMFHLIERSSATFSSNRIADQQQRLRRLTAVVQHVPVYRLCYPSGYHHLPRVRQAVLATLQDA